MSRDILIDQVVAEFKTNPQRGKADNLTSKLAKVTRGRKPGKLRFLFYGEKSIGKSTLAASAPNSIFLSLEGGLRFLDCARYPLPDDDLVLKDVQDAIADLTDNKHIFQHLWLDGLEVLESLIHGVVVPAAARKSGKKYDIISEIGGGFAIGEKLALVDWRDLLSSLERLQRATGISVGFLGHPRLGKRKDVGSVDWDCWEPRIDVRAWNVISDWVDVFGYMAHEQSGFKKDEKNPRSRGQGFGTGKRFVYTAHSPTHYAGRRFPMPDRIEMVHPEEGDPWAPFAHAIDALTSDDEIIIAIKTELKRIDDKGTTSKTNTWIEKYRTKDQLVRTLRKLRSK